MQCVDSVLFVSLVGSRMTAALHDHMTIVLCVMGRIFVQKGASRSVEWRLAGA